MRHDEASLEHIAHLKNSWRAVTIVWSDLRSLGFESGRGSPIPLLLRLDFHEAGLRLRQVGALLMQVVPAKKEYVKAVC